MRPPAHPLALPSRVPQATPALLPLPHALPTAAFGPLLAAAAQVSALGSHTYLKIWFGGLLPLGVGAI